MYKFLFVNLYFNSNYPEKSLLFFSHSKFEITGYKFGIKVVLTGKTFLFRTDKIIKSMCYIKEDNYVVTSHIPLNVCFKAS